MILNPVQRKNLVSVNKTKFASFLDHRSGSDGALLAKLSFFGYPSENENIAGTSFAYALQGSRLRSVQIPLDNAQKVRLGCRLCKENIEGH